MGWFDRGTKFGKSLSKAAAARLKLVESFVEEMGDDPEVPEASVAVMLGTGAANDEGGGGLISDEEEKKIRLNFDNDPMLKKTDRKLLEAKLTELAGQFALNRKKGFEACKTELQQVMFHPNGRPKTDEEVPLAKRVAILMTGVSVADDGNANDPNGKRHPLEHKWLTVCAGILRVPESYLSEDDF